MKKYSNSPKVKKRNILFTNWDRRIEILILKNQGWTYEQIAKKYGVTKQAVYEIYKKISSMTIDELEKMREVKNKLKEEK
jgi:transcriptional regulator